MDNQGFKISIALYCVAWKYLKLLRTVLWMLDTALSFVRIGALKKSTKRAKEKTKRPPNSILSFRRLLFWHFK